ncbi:phage protease [Sagittula sp. S175]|uniref:phage protease n=1 Tax=Sagittula sp. S175 TaxID=3415129 RepID=UPI003C7CD0AE
MNKPLHTTALAATQLPLSAPGEVADWLRIVPKGKSKAYDGRGPFFYDDPERVIANSFGFSPRIHIDENHSTGTAGKVGAPAHAHGYIVEMQEREDGIWGRVDWNPSGKALMQNRSYWGLSPVLMHTKDGQILAITSVALTNDPALRQLAALSAQKETSGMDFLKQVAEILGLGAEASEADVLAALKKKPKGDETALSALSAVTGALGLQPTATQAELVAMVTALQASQDKVATLETKLTKMETDFADKASRDWVQSQLSAGVAIPKGKEDTFVALHKENPARAEELVAMLPKLGTTSLGGTPPKDATQVTALSAEQRTIADQLGVPHETYLAQLQADAKAQEA